jgi:hypothetical protein
MEGRENPHMDKYEEITNDWNYDAHCILASLLISELEDFKHLFFVARSVPKSNLFSLIHFVKTYFFYMELNFIH